MSRDAFGRREELVAIDVDEPEAIFAETKGEARIELDDLGAMPDAGRAFLTAIRDYVVTHPKLEARFATTAVELVIVWRWRA